MPFVPPSELTDIPAPKRKKVQKLMQERAVMGYVFSYEKLSKLLTPDQIESCILAFNEETAKIKKGEVNDAVTAIFAENGIKTLRTVDPFGRMKDFIYMESTSTSFNRNRSIELAPKFGVSSDVLVRLLDAATTKTPYVTLQARDVKEKE